MSKSWKINNNNYLSAQSIWIDPDTTGSTLIDNKDLPTALRNLGAQTIPINRGGTNATTIEQARKNLNITSTLVIKEFSSKSMASGSQVEMAKLTLQPGTYIVLGAIQIGKNGTGYRACWLTTNSSGGPGYSGQTTLGISSYNNFMQSVWPVRITATTTYYFRAYQNSGSALNGTGCIRALQISFT